MLRKTTTIQKEGFLSTEKNGMVICALAFMAGKRIPSGGFSIG